MCILMTMASNLKLAGKGLFIVGTAFLGSIVTSFVVTDQFGNWAYGTGADGKEIPDSRFFEDGYFDPWIITVALGFIFACIMTKMIVMGGMEYNWCTTGSCMLAFLFLGGCIVADRIVTPKSLHPAVITEEEAEAAETGNDAPELTDVDKIDILDVDLLAASDIVNICLTSAIWLCGLMFLFLLIHKALLKDKGIFGGLATAVAMGATVAFGAAATLTLPDDANMIFRLTPDNIGMRGAQLIENSVTVLCGVLCVTLFLVWLIYAFAKQQGQEMKKPVALMIYVGCLGAFIGSGVIMNFTEGGAGKWFYDMDGSTFYIMPGLITMIALIISLIIV